MKNALFFMVFSCSLFIGNHGKSRDVNHIQNLYFVPPLVSHIINVLKRIVHINQLGNFCKGWHAV